MLIQKSQKELQEQIQKLNNQLLECKNVEKLNIWDSIKQCESNCGDRCPVLVFKRNGTDVYAVLKFENFVNLIKERN